MRLDFLKPCLTSPIEHLWHHIKTIVISIVFFQFDNDEFSNVAVYALLLLCYKITICKHFNRNSIILNTDSSHEAEMYPEQ